MSDAERCVFVIINQKSVMQNTPDYARDRLLLRFEFISKKIAQAAIFDLRGLRNDFRTMDWGEVAESLNVRQLEKFLVG